TPSEPPQATVHPPLRARRGMCCVKFPFNAEGVPRQSENKKGTLPSSFCLLSKVLCLLPSLNPRSGVFESQNPWSKYFLLFLCRVVTPVVRENATLKVRHDSQVATILTCQSG